MSVQRTLYVLALFLLISCSNEKTAGKPVVDETPNGLQALILDTQGKPVSGALVTLRPTDYLAGSFYTGYSATDTSDDQGSVAFPDAPKASYRLEAHWRDNQSAMQVFTWDPELPPSETLTLSLQASGEISGQALPDAVVRIYGSELSTIADSAGNYYLTGVPVGKNSVRIDSSLTSTSIPIREEIINVTPFISSSSSFVINSSSSVMDSATTYRIIIPPDPLATSDNIGTFPILAKFDTSIVTGLASRYSEVRALGSASQVYATSLDEIVGDTAYIWILSQNTHPMSGDTFYLQLGQNSLAQNSPKEVFKPSSGNTKYDYAGVWHFAANAPLIDAGEIGYASTTVDSGSSIDNAGVVGSARYFNGSAKIRLPVDSRLNPATLTMSCWIKPDPNNTSATTVFDHGSAFKMEWSNHEMEFWIYPLGGQTSGGLYDNIVDGWNLVVATFDDSTYFNINSNGVGDGITAYLGGVLDYTTTQSPLVLGNNASGTNGFVGSLDECKISSVAFSPEYFRHEFWTQHPSRQAIASPFLIGKYPDPS